MASQAAKGKLVKAATNNVCCSSSGLKRGNDLLDDTQMNSPTYRSQINGLRDWSIEMSGPYDSANTGLTSLLSAFNAGTAVAMQYLPNGTAGFGGQAAVENFDLQGEVAGLETFNVTVRSAGALSAV